MEAHHHPKLSDGKKKQLKEYFLEFLMIFLAVTMGFISENLRERFSDNSKESEYITGMVKNLEVDTVQIRNVIAATWQQIDGIDSLRKVSKDKLSEIKVQDSLYLFTSKYLFYANNFKNDDITLSQLRNAGGYRLIRKVDVLDSIAVYESRIHDLNDQFTDMFTSLEKARDNANSVLDLNAGHNFRLKPASTPVLITTDREKIYKYYNSCWLVLLGLNGYNQMLDQHYKYCARLIAYLKTEYHVE